MPEDPIHRSHVYGWIKIPRTIFEKGHPKKIPVNYFKIRPAVPDERIFKELLKKFQFVAMATRVFDGIKFCEKVLNRTSQGTFLPSFVQIGRVVWEEKMFKEIVENACQMTYNGRLTTDDRHWTTLKAPLEHVVLR